MTVFCELFKRAPGLARQLSAPLAAERADFLRHLANQGTTRSTLQAIAYYLVPIAERLHLAERPGERISLAEVKRHAVSWGHRSQVAAITPPSVPELGRDRFISYATRWLRFMGWLELPKLRAAPHADLVASFSNYLQTERGLSSKSIRFQQAVAQDFLTHLTRWRLSLQTVSPRGIDRWVGSPGYARASVRGRASVLRQFLRYAERKGWCRKGLHEAIKSPRCYAGERIPTGPSWPQVRQLVKECAGDSAKATRDRAIVLLLAVYGLRAGEVVGLRLEDFDWELERLHVRRPKQRQAQEYPLVRSVGDAVLRYLQVRPPSEYREVFLSCKAPRRPLYRGCLWKIVARRLFHMGVTLPHYGPHCLRHACATHLLKQGLSLKEIGDHLGHKSAETTRIYAKVDIQQLREVGRVDLRGLL